MHFAEEARSRKTSISARLVSTTQESYDLIDNHLAKAKIIRLLVVMMEMVAKSMQTRGNLEIIRNELRGFLERPYMSRQMAPALLLVAFLRICRRGPAAELITSSMLPATKSSTIRKMVPVTVPIQTQPIMILGPTTEARGISLDVSSCRHIVLRTNYLQSYVQRRPFDISFPGRVQTSAGMETYKSSNTESTLKQLHRCQNHACIDVANYVLRATRQHHQALRLSVSVH